MLSLTDTQWCLSCDLKLPKTQFSTFASNPVNQSLTAQWPLVIGFASFYFKKGNAIQTLLHQLKYKGNTEVGKRLGETVARDIQKMKFEPSIDYVIPVPLHPSKLLIRGFNQAEIIATVIASGIRCEINTDCLQRSTATNSQTKKSRFNRWENVDSVFAISNESILEHKHVLLVDDVFTTGATIGGCLEKLNDIKGIKLSVVTLAVADY